MSADLKRICVFDRRVLVDEPIYFPAAVPDILDLIEQERARLLVIDPISSFISGNVNNEQVVRRALSPLAAAVAKTGTAILVVRHLTKGSNGKSIYRGSGSIALAGMARSILRVAENPDNADEKLLVQIKSNLSQPARSMRYRLVKGETGVRVAFLGLSQLTVDDLDLPQLDRPLLEEAKDFLCSLLAPGELGVGKVMRAASESGISERTLRRAKHELAVKSGRDGFGPGSKCFWQLNQENEFAREFLRSEKARKAAAEGNGAS
jgi:hypothetical protein